MEAFGLEVGNGNTGSWLQKLCLFWSNLPSSSGLRGFQADSGESARVCARSSTASQAELTKELKFGCGFLSMSSAADAGPAMEACRFRMLQSQQKCGSSCRSQ